MTQVLAWADYVVWLDGPEGPGDRFFQMFDNQYRTNSKKPLLTTYDVAECARVFSETKELRGPQVSNGDRTIGSLLPP
jgi:hypothetical protein